MIPKQIGLRNHMKHTCPKNCIYNSLHSTHFALLLNQSTLLFDLPILVNPSNNNLPYYTLFQAKTASFPHWNHQNIPLLLNSATIFPDTSSDIPSWDVLIASSMVKIVTQGGVPSESLCLVCFIARKFCYCNIDQRRIMVTKESWRKNYF